MVEFKYLSGNIFKVGFEKCDALCVSGTGMAFSLMLNAPNIKFQTEVKSYELIPTEEGDKFYYSIPHKHIEDEKYRNYIVDFLEKVNEKKLKKIIFNASKNIRPENTGKNWSWHDLDDKRVKFIVSVVKNWIKEKSDTSIEQVIFISRENDFTRVFHNRSEICEM